MPLPSRVMSISTCYNETAFLCYVHVYCLVARARPAFVKTVLWNLNSLPPLRLPWEALKPGRWLGSLASGILLVQFSQWDYIGSLASEMLESLASGITREFSQWNY